LVTRFSRISFSAEETSFGYNTGFASIPNWRPPVKRATNDGSSTAIRLILPLSWALICAATIAAPLLATSPRPLAGGLLYLFFSGICHQIPERSFFLNGHPLAVCHRCSGIYFGLFLGSLISGKAFPRFLSIPRRRWWVLAGAVPLVVDALGPMLGFWTNSPLSRAATGALFGIMVSSLLHSAVEELSGSRRPWLVGPSRVHGGS